MNRKNIIFTPKAADGIEMDGILHDARVIVWSITGTRVVLTVNERNVPGFLVKLRQYGTAEMTD